jgi:hypothetical protein
MTEKDKKIYKNIFKKILENKKDTMTYEEGTWLMERPELMDLAKKLNAKVKIMARFPEYKNTIEEILFILDLSDRFLR